MRLTIQRKLILSFLLISLIPTAFVIVLFVYMQDRVMEQVNALNLKSLSEEVQLDLVQKRQESNRVAQILVDTWETSETLRRLKQQETMSDEDREDIRKWVNGVFKLLSFQSMEWELASELEEAGLEFPRNVSTRKDTDLIHVPGWLPTEATSVIHPRPPSEWIGVSFPLKVNDVAVEHILVGYPIFVYDGLRHFSQDQGVLIEMFKQGWHKTRHPNATLSVAQADSPEFLASLDQYGPEWKDELLVKGRATQIQRLKETSQQAYMYPLFDSEGERPRAILMFAVPSNDASLFRVWELWRYSRRLAYAMIPGAIVISIVFAVYLSRRIARPVRNLSASAIAISHGHYEQEIQAPTRDEVGDLAHAFNRMTSRLRESFDEINLRAKTIEEQNIALDQTVHDLRQERAYVENILRTVSNGVITVDTLGVITRINGDACATLGVPDATGMLMELLLKDRGFWDAVSLALKEGVTQRNKEMTVRREDGKAIPLSVSTALLRSGEETIGVVLSFSDLSSIKALQEQVRRQERLAALGSLSAGVAHEIRNPLGIIKGSAEILRKRFGGQHGEEGLCNDIIEEVNRLSRVVTEFLEFARPRQPSLEEVSVDEVLKRTLDLMASQTPESVIVDKRFNAQEALVNVDPEQCRQVFLNLFLNACEAMPGGGTLSIRSEVEPDTKEVRVDIADTGVGITEEALGQIFNPFFTTKNGGTGLGLSICHRIMDTHGGRIEVDSHPGSGSVFRLYFPAIRMAGSAAVSGGH